MISINLFLLLASAHTYIITSSETQETLKLALQKLRPVFPKPPRCFMVDKDMSEINALNAVFPESDVLLCWYHVLQAVVRWLMKSDSGVSGLHSSNTRREILDSFKKMKACAMKTDFDRVAKEFLKDFSHCQEVCKYFQRYWEPISHRWDDYGRCYNHGNSETNNLIERDQSLVVIFSMTLLRVVHSRFSCSVAVRADFLRDLPQTKTVSAAILLENCCSSKNSHQSAVSGQSLTSSDSVMNKSGESVTLSCTVSGISVSSWWMGWILRKY
ncbi:PT0181Ig heavy chain V region 99A precursor - goldfish [Labeo rohita]|uniref:PT0181Ig heavy chain V region 99A-goldfish n=1 Tax=Labeo rohita TaxID=84645 RepID=A0A498N4Q1_LABRO|nr:PT0181Ig heavy chain V region 99A precursor - goldfish [Labeo rohita]